MTDVGETPKNITVDTWMDYAKRGKIDEFVQILDGQMNGAKLPFEFVDFEKTSPTAYVNSLRQYTKDLGRREKKVDSRLLDLFTFRKLSEGLKKAEEASKDERYTEVDTVEFNETSKAAFWEMFEDFDRLFYKYMDKPELTVSVFRPAMEVMSEISDDYMQKVLNTYAGREDTQKILKVFEEGKKPQENI